MKKLILLFFGFILISLVGAEVNPCGNDESFLGTFEKGETINLMQTCDTCTYVNLSQLTFPNSSLTYYNKVMTKKGIEYNYTFSSTNDLGCYAYSVFGDKDGTLKDEIIYFKITPSGQDFDTGQALGGLGIFGGVLAVAFAFLFIGSKLSKEEKTLPLGFFFMVMAIILVIFSLYLGWAFSIDILQHETISEGISLIFVIVLWTSSGMAVIFIALMLFAFIKELGKINKKKKFGEDFNPITDTYE